ncbi:MAG: c-type cytochrome [Sideroxydans sp.]
MKKLWMLCALLLLAGCQGEKSQPAPSASVDAAAPVAAVPAVSIVETDAAVMALARKSNCFACHALDKKIVGPAWKTVAAKYRGDVNAQIFLENKIAKGGGGVWGAVPMPAQPELSTEQRAKLARFILNLE